MRLLVPLATCVAICSVACSSPRSTVAETEAPITDAIGSRPPNVPLDFIWTENGFFHPSCVITVHNHETVTPNGDIIQPDGSIRTVSPCAYDHYDGDGNVTVGPLATRARKVGVTPRPLTIGHDFIEAFTSYTDPNITWFSNEMTVPPNPHSSDGQIIGLWGGVQDNGINSTEVLQPVLAWGEGGNNRWQVRGENCCQNGNDYGSDYYPVNVGDTFDGWVSAEPIDENLCWGAASQFGIGVNINGGVEVEYTACSWNSSFVFAIGGALEVYNVSRCGDLPQADYGVNVNNIDVYVNGTPVSPSWVTYDNTATSPDCTPQTSASGSSGWMWWKDYN